MMLSILLVSLLAGVFAFLFGRGAVELVERDAAGKLRRAALPAEPAPERRRVFTTALGRLVGRFAPGYVRSLEGDLYWSAFFLAYRKGARPSLAAVSAAEVAAVLGRQVLMSGLLALAALFALRSNAALIAGFLGGWALTRMDLRSRADYVRGRLSQELPEFVQLMAAESASGAGLDEVIARAAEGASLVARWVKGVLSLLSGRSLLAPIEQDPDGLLHYEAMRSGHLPLAILAIQLAYARRGVQVRPLLESLARGYSDDFVSQASIRAEKLGNTLGMATALFYALPFLVAVLTVVGYPLLKVLFGG